MEPPLANSPNVIGGDEKWENLAVLGATYLETARPALRRAESHGVGSPWVLPIKI